MPPPVDRKQLAHEKAQKSARSVKDELADLREQMDLTPLSQTKNLSGAVGADSHAERSMITSKVGAGSGRYHVRQQQPWLRYRRRLADRPRHDGGDLEHRPSRRRQPGARPGPARAARRRARVRRSSWCSIATRAPSTVCTTARCANSAELQGKLVLEFTDRPSGEVTMCRVVSSELNDPDLEKQDRRAREAVPLRGQGRREHHHHQAHRLLPASRPG